MAGEYLSTDPNAGLPPRSTVGYLSTDPNAGERIGPKDVPGSSGHDAGVPAAQPTSVMDFVKGIPGAARAVIQGTGAGLAGRATEILAPGKGLAVHKALSPDVSDPGAETLRVLGHAASASGLDKLQGLGPMAMPGGAATNLAKPAARQAARSPEAGALKAIPGKVADMVTPKPAPEIASLARKAEAMGIELRPDMLSDNRIARSVGEALEQVPLTGSKKDQRQIAFNSALTKIVGGDNRAKRLTPDVFDQAMTKSGEKIGQIAKETPIPLTGELQSSVMAHVQQVQKFETSDVAKVVSNYVSEFAKKAEGGVIPGETFRKINSQIGKQIRQTSNGDLKNALRDLQDIMHDALEANIKSPERLAELKDARFKYAMGKIIEPLVAKAKGGDISPAALMGAVTSDSAKKTMMARGRGGEIGDLARIGQAFMKEPGSSGTAERNLAYGLIGDTAAIARDALVFPAAQAYNRLGPKLTKRAIEMRDVDPQTTQPWNLGVP